MRLLPGPASPKELNPNLPISLEPAWRHWQPHACVWKGFDTGWSVWRLWIPWPGLCHAGWSGDGQPRWSDVGSFPVDSVHLNRWRKCIGWVLLAEQKRSQLCPHAGHSELRLGCPYGRQVRPVRQGSLRDHSPVFCLGWKTVWQAHHQLFWARRFWTPTSGGWSYGIRWFNGKRSGLYHQRRLRGKFQSEFSKSPCIIPYGN